MCFINFTKYATGLVSKPNFLQADRWRQNEGAIFRQTLSGHVFERNALSQNVPLTACSS